MTPADERIAAEVARWAIIAITSEPRASHEELVETLAGLGLPFPDHALTMVTLAFGRRLLDGLVALPPTYKLGNHERAYAADPVFAAALELAASASKEQLETIATRSAEVRAVNQALHAGSQPGDLVLATVMLGPPQGKPPERFGGADVTVDQIARSHAANLTLETRVFPQRVRRGEATMQIDVVAKHDGRAILESFAGIGPTIIDAQKQALVKFAESTLHVFVAALGGRDLCPEHVEWRTWGNFDVCSGTVMRQWSSEPAYEHQPLFDAILAALPPALSHELHWFRLFVAVGDGKILGLDAMLDNATYAPVVELVQSWPWPAGQHPYALRHFFMLVPKPTE